LNASHPINVKVSPMRKQEGLVRQGQQIGIQGKATLPP
jgi:hypothetical protein